MKRVKTSIYLVYAFRVLPKPVFRGIRRELLWEKPEVPARPRRAKRGSDALTLVADSSERGGGPAGVGGMGDILGLGAKHIIHLLLFVLVLHTSP